MRIQGAFSFPSRTAAPAVSESQLNLASLQASFSHEAGNPMTAATLLGAGLSYQLGRSIATTLLASSPVRVLPRVLAPLVGLHFETALLHASHHLGGASLATEQTNRYQSFYATFFDMGMLKCAGLAAASASTPVRHLLQSSAMVASHRILAALGVGENNPRSSLLGDLLAAEVVNLQMEATSRLAHAVGGYPIQRIQGSLAVRERQSLTNASSAISESLPVFASHEMIQWSRGIKPSGVSRWLESHGMVLFAKVERTIRLWFFEKSFKRAEVVGRLYRLDALYERLIEASDASTVEFLTEALKRSYSYLGRGSQEELASKILIRVSSFSEDPAKQIRFTILLRHFLPRLSDNSLRVRVLRSFAGAIVSPLTERASYIFREAFAPSLGYLNREELLTLADELRRLEFQPIFAMDSVREMYEMLFDRLEMTRRQESLAADRVAEMKVLGSYLSHDVFAVGRLAQERLFQLAKASPQEEAAAALNGIAQGIPKDFLTQLRWIEAFQNTGAASTSPEWLRTFQQVYYRQQLDAVERRVGTLRPPTEWQDIHRVLESFEGLESILNLQQILRERFLSAVPDQIAIANRWWEEASVEERWLILQIITGSRAYVKLSPLQAMRLRSLAAQGLESETGLAIDHRDIQNPREVIFVLGNYNSVSMPMGFIEEHGMAEAMGYVMLHHTHPLYQRANDYHQIYPSCHIEGSGSGDLYSMFKQQEQFQFSDSAYSVMHRHGGSIFVLRDHEGKRFLDIYAALRETGRNIPVYHFENTMTRIEDFARQNRVLVRFWKVPFDWIETMKIPPVNARVQDHPGLRRN